MKDPLLAANELLCSDGVLWKEFERGIGVPVFIEFPMAEAAASALELAFEGCFIRRVSILHKYSLHR